MALENYTSVGPIKFNKKKPIRPKGFSRRSNTPYYKEIYALKIKAVCDSILETHRPQLWLYRDWPEYKPNTLYQLVSYGLLYLTDNLDPSGKYLSLKNVLKIHPMPKNKPLGLAIYIRRDVNPSTLEVDPRAFLPREFDDDGRELTQMIQEYLADENNKAPFELNTVITPKVQERIHSQLIPLEGAITYIIDDEHVKIIKLV